MPWLRYCNIMQSRESKDVRNVCFLSYALCASYWGQGLRLTLLYHYHHVSYYGPDVILHESCLESFECSINTVEHCFNDSTENFMSLSFLPSSVISSEEFSPSMLHTRINAMHICGALRIKCSRLSTVIGHHAHLHVSSIVVEEES